MVMTDDDRTTILAQGRPPMEPARGRHRPQSLANDYDDYDPYEDEEEERRRRRKKGWIIALVSVLALALIGFIAWLMSSVFSDKPVSTEVTVPNVVGRLADDAQRTLTDQGFDVALQNVPCQPTPQGQNGPCGPDSVGKVIDSNPKPNTKMNKSDLLTLLVGAPPEKVQVPDVTGRTPEEAKQLLEQQGLSVAPDQATEEVQDEADVGKVISQDPVPNTPVSKGTAVKLTVGKAQQTVSVPNLVGQDVNTARTNLENLGFKVQVNEVSSDKPAGTVVDQSPKDGTQPPGSTITLSVSKGDQTKLTMVNLQGLTQQEAESRLRSMGWTGNFNVRDGQTTNPAEFQKIIDQEIGEGQPFDKNQTIGIIIATSLGSGG
jgi:serine/threonine-protein kinase